jgi:hypothetical protein
MYLTPPQVDEFFRATFPQTEPELIGDLTMRGWACPDLHRGTDPANIPVMRVLQLGLGEDQDMRVRRLRTMLAFYRPVPRMTRKRFAVFLKSLICNIDPTVIDSLYRSLLTYNTLRVDLDPAAFAEYFLAFQRPVVPDGWEAETIDAEGFAELSPLYARVLSRWNRFSPFLTQFLLNLTASGSQGVAQFISQIRYELFQLLEARISFDAILFYQCFHCLLRSVMQACLKLRVPDAMTLAGQLTALHRGLMKKLHAATSAKDDASVETDE